ncbi:MAG: SAM-dependent methyltransferase, partial [Actinomycetota bacterium]|nr:SAM-dependent methyltransferase [Actinomycetota bacterium]
MEPLDPRPASAVRTDLVDALRNDLEAAGYTVAGVQALVGPMASAALGRERALPALRATADARDALAVITRTFLLGRPTTRGALDAALRTLTADGAARLGLVEASGADDGDLVRPLLDVRPYEATD